MFLSMVLVKIYVTRHGQTDWNVEHRVQGKADIDLNEKGIKQAEIIAEKLKYEKIDVIVCSPLKRARQTVDVINKNRNITTIYDEGISESDFMEIERLNNLAEKFKENEYEVYVLNTREEAKALLLKLCENKVVGIGDSHTINDIDIIKDLQKQNKELYAMQLDKSRENKLKSMITDIFILSANAVSEETGEMVNIDSSCNRIAPSLYGPEQVVFVIGTNKIEKNLISAINRVKNYVAPMNAKSHNYETPCAYTGKCTDCKSKDRICRATVIYHKRPKKTPTTIILVNENLGW